MPASRPHQTEAPTWRGANDAALLLHLKVPIDTDLSKIDGKSIEELPEDPPSPVRTERSKAKAGLAMQHKSGQS
eukprot:6487906-Amphidinium_carterae.1